MIAAGSLVAGRYEILDRISEGGMATVFRARRLTDGQTVALKILREQFASDSEFLARFEREARAVRALSHPHMVRVHDSGTDGNVHYIAMEYVEGENLKDLIRREGPLPPARAAQIAAQVADVLEYAHAHGIVHRDIKPQNILLTRDGQVKVTDFGIARAMSAATITHTGTVLGSVQYLSPEQARGAPVGPSTDIYSLGVVLYEMVTGTLPFDGDSPIATALAHVNQPPPPPRSRAPTLPVRIEGIILFALAKSPSRRYRSPGEMRGDLLGETDLWSLVSPHTFMEPPAPSAAEVAPPQVRRRLPAPAVALAAALLLLGGLWSGWQAFTRYLSVPEVAVPGLIGRPLPVAQQMVESAGLTLVVRERVYHSAVPAEAVVSQDQPPGKAVKRGRVIGVVVSLGPEIVLVPDVQRRSLIEARLLIEQRRLVVGELREQFHEEVRGGFVIAQDPQPGARVERGRPVNLVVSKGPQRVEMPPLVGRPLHDARRILQDLGVTLSEVRTAATTEVDPGIVIEQSPQAGTRIRPTDRVTVVVAMRPGEESTPPPTAVVTAQPQPSGNPEEKVTRVQLIVPEGDPEQAVRIVVIDEQGLRTVFERTLPPGARVDEAIKTRGYTIIQVYVQNRLIQEIRP